VLAPALRPAANAQGYGLVRLSRGACPPLTGATVYDPKQQIVGAWCSQFNSQALSVIENDQSIQIVILSGFWEMYLSARAVGLTADSAHEHTMPAPDASRQLLERSLRATIQSLRAAGKQVIVFEDVPDFAFDPVSRVRTASIPARHALEAMLGAVDATDPGFASPDMISETAMANSAIEQAAAGLQGVTIYDLRPEFCSSALHCVYRDGERLLYFDKNHVTPDGSRYALRDFRLPALARESKEQVPGAL
jgi:hypothetical protein